MYGEDRQTLVKGVQQAHTGTLGRVQSLGACDLPAGVQMSPNEKDRDIINALVLQEKGLKELANKTVPEISNSYPPLQTNVQAQPDAMIPLHWAPSLYSVAPHTGFRQRL